MTAIARVLVSAALVGLCECQIDDSTVLLQSYLQQPEHPHALAATNASQRFKADALRRAFSGSVFSHGFKADAGAFQKKLEKAGFKSWNEWKEHKKAVKALGKALGKGWWAKGQVEDAAQVVTSMHWEPMGKMPKPALLTMLNRARLGNRLFQWSALLSIAKEAGARVAAPSNPKYTPTSTPQLSQLEELIWDVDSFEWLNEQPNKCHMWDNGFPLTVNWGLNKLSNWTLAGVPKGEKQIQAAQQPRRGMNWAKMWADAIMSTPTPSPCQIVELDGFWQRAEFFVQHLDWLRPTFWNAEVAGRAKKVLDNWLEVEGQVGAVVGVHLRLGDYIGMGRNLAMQYYVDSLEEVKKRRNVKSLTCVIFSDDINLASNVSLELDACTKRVPVYPCAEYGAKYHCWSSQKVVNDKVSFYMMGQLPNIVIADSTYSFWAALLAPHNPLVMAPKIVKPERIARRGDYSYLNSELYGPNWVNMNATVGDHTSQAVRDALHLVQDQGYAAEVRNSEWAA